MACLCVPQPPLSGTIYISQALYSRKTQEPQIKLKCLEPYLKSQELYIKENLCHCYMVARVS